MPYLYSKSTSSKVLMSTQMNYYTLLNAIWITGTTYHISLYITREEVRTKSERDAGKTVGWNVPTESGESHYCTIEYIGEDGTKRTENIPLGVVTVKINDDVNDTDYRTTMIFEKQITVSSTDRRLLVSYNATVNNSGITGKFDSASFTTPPITDNGDGKSKFDKIKKEDWLPGPPNVFVKVGSEWKRAKELWMYKGGKWKVVPNGQMNIYYKNKWSNNS